MNNIYYVLLLLALVFLFLVDILLGSVSIPGEAILQILFRQEVEQQVWESIIWMIRFPRAVTAILAGVSLSVAGLMMQTLFRNPLAGPSVLGISSGASIGVAFMVMGSGVWFGQSFQADGWLQSGWSLVIAASLGAFLVTGIILLISFKVRDNVVLLIVGIMMGAFASSLVGIWQYFSHPESLQNYVIWTFGSLSGVPPKQLGILAYVVFLGGVISFLLIKNLNILLLGENYARSSGLNVKNSRVMIISVSSLLTGGVTAFCGPIGFVGIAVPHLVRGLFRTSDHGVLLPGCALLGSIFMLICDIITKIPFQTGDLPINIITSIIGAPLVILIITRNTNLKTAF